MVADSYCATCYIENDNGTYHMECDMTCGDNSEPIFSCYDGEDFINGLNVMMSDMSRQMADLVAEETKEETPEEKIARLEKAIKQLETENKDLTKIINDFNNNEKNTRCQCRQSNVPDYLLNIFDEIMKNDKNHDWIKFR